MVSRALGCALALCIGCGARPHAAPAAATDEAITLYRDRGLSLFSTAVGTNASTALVTIRMDVSYNGSNWTTTAPLQWSYPLNGTTPVTAWTNFPPSVLDNVKKARIASVSNAHSASIHFTNVVSSISP